MRGHSFHDALFEICSNHCHKPAKSYDQSPAQLTPSPKKQTTFLHSTAQAQLSSLPTVYQGHCQHLPADKKLQLLSALLSTIGVCLQQTCKVKSDVHSHTDDQLTNG
jgi:hypothetical protein